MSNLYYYPKKDAVPQIRTQMQIFFEDGECLTIKRNEIKDISLELCDNLVWCENEACRKIYSGEITLDILPSKKLWNNDNFSFETAKLTRDNYIVRKMQNSIITHIRVFDDDYWNTTFFGNAKVSVENNRIVISYSPSLLDKNESENCQIPLNNITKDIIRCIDIDFENCDGISVYQSEIKEISLTFNEKLENNASDLIRQVNGGFIRIKFDKEYDYGRSIDLFPKIKNKQKAIRERLIDGKENEHDICHLYIHYYYCGYGREREECVDIPDLFTYSNDNEVDEGKYYPYISGYCKENKDGSITIFFGKINNKNVE